MSSSLLWSELIIQKVNSSRRLLLNTLCSSTLKCSCRHNEVIKSPRQSGGQYRKQNVQCSPFHEGKPIHSALINHHDSQCGMCCQLFFFSQFPIAGQSTVSSGQSSYLRNLCKRPAAMVQNRLKSSKTVYENWSYYPNYQIIFFVVFVVTLARGKATTLYFLSEHNCSFLISACSLWVKKWYFIFFSIVDLSLEYNFRPLEQLFQLKTELMRNTFHDNKNVNYNAGKLKT